MNLKQFNIILQMAEILNTCRLEGLITPKKTSTKVAIMGLVISRLKVRVLSPAPFFCQKSRFLSTLLFYFSVGDNKMTTSDLFDL
jgi:hypothetical protein